MTVHSKCKILRVKLVLSNGIDQEVHYFKLESAQPDFYDVKVGQFALLSSNFRNNFVTFGRVVGVICNEKQVNTILKSPKLKVPRVMKIIQLTEKEILDLLEGVEVS
ncbi:hypothetical protein, partial [Lactococcus taiwanensis]|uniref:hypothetical protein n=1 Tax=Lactococcus taiwanensis TaxID=1151742 RepID=UPI0035143D64